MAIRPKIIGPRPIERKVVRPAAKPAATGGNPPAKGPVPPIKPPVTPVNTPTVTPPVNTPVAPVVNTTVTPPVNTPVAPIVNTTVNTPVIPVVNTTVTPPVNRPVTPVMNSTVPPVNNSVTPPVNSVKAQVKEKPQVAPKVKVAQPKSESNVNTAVVMLSLLVVLLLGGVGYLMYDKFNHSGSASVDPKENVEVSKSDMDMEIAQINKLQDSIRVIIAQKEALGQELADERAKLGELEELKNQVRNSQLSINSLTRKLSKFKDEVHTAKASMATMEISNKELALEKENLQKLIQAKDDSLKSLASAQSALSEKVALASSLKAQSVNVTVFNTAGKELGAAASYKAMLIRKVKVSYSFADNKVAPHGPKDVYMRLIEPSGSTLFEGERIFMLNGRKTFYSDKQTVNFDNSQQTFDFVYTERSRYKPGKYAIELYTDGQKIGDGSFTLVK